MATKSQLDDLRSRLEAQLNFHIDKLARDKTLNEDTVERIALLAQVSDAVERQIETKAYDQEAAE